MIRWVLALAAVLSMGASCDGKAHGEGYFEMNDTSHFGHSGYHALVLNRAERVKISVGRCQRRTLSDVSDLSEEQRRSRQAELVQVNAMCERAYEYTIEFMYRAASVSGLVENVACENLNEHVIRCVGGKNATTSLEDLRYVTYVRDDEVIGFHVWRMRPMSPEALEGPVSPDVPHGPELLGTFGDGSRFVPRD